MQNMPGRADLIELDETISAIRERLSSLSTERSSLTERMERINQNLRQIKTVRSLCCYQCRSQLSLGSFTGSRLSVQSGSSLASSVSCCSENGFGLDECDDASSLSDSSSIASYFSPAQVCYRHRKAAYKPSALQLEVLPHYTKDGQSDLTKIPEVTSLSQTSLSDESSGSELDLLQTSQSTYNFATQVSQRRRASLQATRSDSCLDGQSVIARRPFSIYYPGWKGSNDSIQSTASTRSCIRGLETAV